jgi:hypothetical protein
MFLFFPRIPSRIPEYFKVSYLPKLLQNIRAAQTFLLIDSIRITVFEQIYGWVASTGGNTNIKIKKMIFIKKSCEHN